MPAELQLWHPDHLGDAKGKLQFRAVNTLNTPIVSAAWRGDGRAIADVYELVCTNVVGATATFTRECLVQGTKNPYRDMVGVTATADDATANPGLVPGLNIVLDGDIAIGWKGRVAIYNYLDDDGSYTAFFSYGTVQSGEATAGQRVAVKNVGDATGTQAKIYALPGFYWTGTSGAEGVVKAILPHTSASRHKLAAAGTYTITFSDFKDAGGGKKSCDINVGGTKCVEDALMDGTSTYEYGVAGYNDGADLLAGLSITLADTTDDPTGITVTLKVTSDYTRMEFAPDESGSPGTYANQDLTLTQATKPAGTIEASGSAFLWHRDNQPGAAAPGDLRKYDIELSALTV